MNLKKIFLISFIAILVILIVLNRSYFTYENLNSLLAYLGPWSPAVFILIYCITPILFVPGTVMTIIGGFIFGIYWGTLYSLIGGTIGASLAFLMGRYIAKDWTKNEHTPVVLIEKKLSRSDAIIVEVKRGIDKDGWRYIAFTRLVPVFPYSILNYAFGLTKISLVTFAVTSFISLIPGTLVYSYIGYVGQEAANCSQDLFLKISLVIGLILLIGFFANKAKTKIALE